MDTTSLEIRDIDLFDISLSVASALFKDILCHNSFFFFRTKISRQSMASIFISNRASVRVGVRLCFWGVI